MVLALVTIYVHMFHVCLSYNLLLNLSSFYSCLHGLNKSREFRYPWGDPKMAGLSYMLVLEHIAIYKAMVSLGCREVGMVIGFNMLMFNCRIVIVLFLVVIGCSRKG